MVVSDENFEDFTTDEILSRLQFDDRQDQTKNIVKFLVRQQVNESLETFLFFVFRVLNTVIIRCWSGIGGLGIDQFEVLVRSRMWKEPGALHVLPLHFHELKQGFPEVGIHDIVILSRLLGNLLHELKSLVELFGHDTILHISDLANIVLACIPLSRVRRILSHQNLSQALHLAELHLRFSPATPTPLRKSVATIADAAIHVTTLDNDRGQLLVLHLVAALCALPHTLG